MTAIYEQMMLYLAIIERELVDENYQSAASAAVRAARGLDDEQCEVMYGAAGYLLAASKTQDAGRRSACLNRAIAIVHRMRERLGRGVMQPRPRRLKQIEQRAFEALAEVLADSPTIVPEMDEAWRAEMLARLAAREALPRRAEDLLELALEQPILATAPIAGPGAFLGGFTAVGMIAAQLEHALTRWLMLFWRQHGTMPASNELLAA